VGGFDDRFFMYFEDVDLGYRLGKAGWKSVYLPSAIVTHTGAHSTSTESSRMIKAHHRSAYRYLSQKYSAWYFAPLRWALRLGLMLRAWWLTSADRRR
jgi:N-acetylglucosaminyl-diphospho-decaprenol L-rhamnosyltransferase